MQNRLYFNSLVGEKFEITWMRVPYTIVVRKKRSCTELHGEWSIFVHDHQLAPGDCCDDVCF
uniref:TF-B3 domain-containing protein n=1 Tax=Arundo donax TaxID=35708 RepID=A0A0A8Y300_ARUDO